MLLTSLALLRRRPWAHRAFSGLISLCVVVLAGTLVLGLLHPNPLPSDAGGNYLLLLRIIEAVSLVFPLLVCAGLVWICPKSALNAASVADHAGLVLG